MIMYMSGNGYSVYAEDDGDDMWVSVRHKGERLFECITGGANDSPRIRDYVRTAYSQFYPANYVIERLKATDDCQRMCTVMQEACGIDHALKMAMGI